MSLTNEMARKGANMILKELDEGETYFSSDCMLQHYTKGKNVDVEDYMKQVEGLISKTYNIIKAGDHPAVGAQFIVTKK